MTHFRCVPIPTETAQRWRQTGLDDAGNPLRRSIATGTGAPCRHCLRNGTKGEEMLLGSYHLPGPTGIYWTPSPIFLHARACAPYTGQDEIADIIRTSLISVRAYNADQIVLYDLGRSPRAEPPTPPSPAHWPTPAPPSSTSTPPSPAACSAASNAPKPHCRMLREEARSQVDKSFLVLFFKKEQALLFEKRSKNFLSICLLGIGREWPISNAIPPPSPRDRFPRGCFLFYAPPKPRARRIREQRA